MAKKKIDKSKTRNRGGKNDLDTQILDYIANNAYTKIDTIAEALNIEINDKNPDYTSLKKRLALLVDKERVERKENGKYIVPQNVGYILAQLKRPANNPKHAYLHPISWPEGAYHKKPKAMNLGKDHLISLRDAKDGEVFVVRTQSEKKGKETVFNARLIDRLEEKTAGIVEIKKDGSYRIKPASRKKNYSLPIADWALKGAEEGDLVEFKITNSTFKDGTPSPIVTRRVGGSQDWHSISPMVATEFGLTQDFNDKVMDELAQLEDPDWTTQNRTDLRDLDLLTIDDVTTTDMDDAMLAEPVLDKDGKQTGWHLIVAIADVAQYVKVGGAIDKEAQFRGNTNYLPGYRCDMIPSEIATDKSSLVPDEDRSCLAMHMWIDMNGNLSDYKLQRGIMRSRAKLHHKQVEEAIQGNPDEQIAPHLDHIKNLYAAYKPLAIQSKKRQKLPISSKEQKIAFTADGEFDDIKLIDYMDINRVIEEYMVLANVCAAMTLIEKGYPGLYRTHKKPRENGKAIHGEALNALGYAFNPEATGSQMRKQLIRILNESTGSDEQEIVHQLVTMMQSRAEYSTDQDEGHYGLSLKHYAHFTSPIRRYADLMVHRFLIDACGLGDDGLKADYNTGKLRSIAEHISARDDLAKRAEREAKSRFCAAWLENAMVKIASGEEAEEYDAIITKADREGLIIKLKKNGVEGHIPIEHLPGTANYHFIHRYNALAGREQVAPETYRDLIYQQGASLKVKISSASAALNSMKFEPVVSVSAIIPKYQNSILGELDNLEREDTGQKRRRRRNSSADRRKKRQERHVRNRPSD